MPAPTTITLNDGNRIPAVGFGVFMIPNGGPTYDAVRMALDAGYRHIDTAAAYQNESDVGRAVRDSGIPREDVWVTTKLWPQDYGRRKGLRGVDLSLANLGLDYVDLMLLHQPYGDVDGAWRALEDVQAAGKVRSIGVSNMTARIWGEHEAAFEVTPAVNQVEFNPFFQQCELRAKLDTLGVVLEAWYPLGHGNAALLQAPAIASAAEAHGKNPGQVVLRFEVQEGVVTLPKSTNPGRIRGNLGIFDFELTDAEMDAIRAMDTGCGTHDPEDPRTAAQLTSFRVHA